MKKINCLFIVLSVVFLFSCSDEETLFESKESVSILSEAEETLLEDIILPMEGDRDTLKRPLSLKSLDYTKEEIDQLKGIPFYLQAQGNSTSKQFLNATTKGKELTVANYSGKSNQQFYIRILPATSGIPYLIYSKNTNTPIRIGAYSNKPDVKILYASNDDSGSLFGASWDFNKAENSPNSYVIENQDYPQQGSSGNWWDIYYSVITVNDAKISFSKYIKSPRQEFAIVPVETFKVEEIKFNIDASAILEKLPDVVFLDGYSNKGPINQTHSFSMSESYKETSNFTKKTSYDVKISTEIKAKVPFIASGSITTSTSFGQEYTYGKSEERSMTLTRVYPVDIPAYHRAELTLTLFKYNMDVEYVAVCRGLTSGEKINIKGRWTGVDVVETDAVLEVFPINGGTSIRTVITKEMLNSGNPIKVK